MAGAPYVESCRPGDRRTHRVMLTVRKEGSRLTFENHGSAPQDGAMNATYSGWRSSVMVAINELLCWDQYFAVGGALRHIDFNPTPGTFNCANFPGSVSTAPIPAMEISLYPACNALSKMIHPDPEMRRDILCIGGTSQWPCTVFRGIDQWGERYGYILVDPIGGAIGAFAHADGINTGGQVRTPICQLPNIEHTEQSFPVLFLYRKELPDSGGAGRFRGGMSAESCFIPHNTEEIVQDTLSSGNAAPTSPGMMGGYPSATNRYACVTGSDIGERFARAEMPEDIDEVEGTPVHLELRQQNLVQRASDVYAVRWCGGGGFGDPMERAPEAIQADLDNFAISEGAARDIYAAVLDEETGQVDAEATARHRERLRAERVARFGRAHRPTAPRGHPVPAREARRAGSVLGLPEVQRRARRHRGQLQARLQPGGPSHLHLQPAHRRAPRLHRRRHRVPSVLVPGLRDPHRERGGGRERPGVPGHRASHAGRTPPDRKPIARSARQPRRGVGAVAFLYVQ